MPGSGRRIKCHRCQHAFYQTAG
ncbi:MAG: hypothetical protein ACREUM_11350 [Nitrosospira sp.]